MTRKPQLLTKTLVGFAFALGATVTFSQPNHARDPDKFFCGMSNGQPTTIVRTSRGNIPMIRWVDQSFPPPWTPARRCEEISARFQRFYRNGLLNYIKAGWSNRQPVLCVAAYKGGACLSNGVLVTLKPGSNPQKVLERLQDRQALASGRTILLSSDLFSTVDGEMYFNIGGFLAEDDQEAEPPYQIQTPDGQIYQADVPQNVSFPGHDLALLQFHSRDGRYPVASLGTSPRVGGEVFAAGFPFVDDLSQVPVIRDKQGGFVLQVGQVSLILDKALEGGYRIGYTNPVEKGMSGGPLLNNRGQVVGINGMHAEPLWGDPYIYMDGSIPEPDLREQMSHYSWGIPIDAFVQFAPPAFIPRSRNNLPSHNRGKNSDHQPDSLPYFLGIFPNLSPNLSPSPLVPPFERGVREREALSFPDTVL